MAPDFDLNVCTKGINLHDWQRDTLHGLDSFLGLSCLDLTFALTRMSLRLFGSLNAIIGFSEKIKLSFVFVSMICQCLSMMSCNFLKIRVVRYYNMYYGLCLICISGVHVCVCCLFW